MASSLSGRGDQPLQEALEFVATSDPEFDRLCGAVLESYPNACVLSVERVVSAQLEAAYQAYTASLPPHARQRAYGWHGTPARNVCAIVREGFDPACNVRSSLGRGTYVAQRAVYSKDYADVDSSDASYMFYCEFAYTSLCQAQGQAGKSAGGIRYCSGSGIYAVPQRHAVVPRYLVAFHRSSPP